VIPVRLERTTHSLEGCCSIQLSYGTIFRRKITPFFNFCNLSHKMRRRYFADYESMIIK
jgi:hypothetical protein